MRDEFSKLLSFVTTIGNPTSVVLDRLGLRRAPYVLKLRESGDVVELRPRTGDLFGFFEIMVRGDYFAAGQSLRGGDVVVDIGANIGCFSILAAKRVGKHGHVYAIEPEESTFRQLQRNIDLNNLTNVTALRIAVGKEQGTTTLHSGSNRLFSSVFTTVNGYVVEGSEQQIEMTTIDHLMKARKIVKCNYLKLDCEGAEHDIIASLSPSIAERIEQITMEVHKVPGRSSEAIADRLASLGYARVGDSTLPFYRRSLT